MMSRFIKEVFYILRKKCFLFAKAIILIFVLFLVSQITFAADFSHCTEQCHQLQKRDNTTGACMSCYCKNTDGTGYKALINCQNTCSTGKTMIEEEDTTRPKCPPKTETPVNPDDTSGTICGKPGDTKTDVNPNVTLAEYRDWCVNNYNDPNKYEPKAWNDNECKCKPKPIISVSTEIPGLTKVRPDGSLYFTGGLPEYLIGLYKFFIAAAMIVSLCVIIIAGFRWIISGGNQSTIGKSKESIKSAVIGVLIALFSYSILYFVNPSLTDFSIMDIVAIPGIMKTQITTTGELALPVKNGVITQFYGPAFCSTAPCYKKSWGGEHNGVDIVAPAKGSTDIFAVAAGKVINAKTDSGYGCYVIIQHEEDRSKYTTLYAHLNETLVQEGQSVQAGQKIGVMGGQKGNPCAGTSFGLHLHFEVRENGKKIDPFSVFSVQKVSCSNSFFTEKTCQMRINTKNENGKTGSSCINYNICTCENPNCNCPTNKPNCND